MVKVADDVVLDHVGVQIRADKDGLCHGEHDHIVEADLTHRRIHRLEHGTVGLDLRCVEGILLRELGHGGKAVRHGFGGRLADGAELDVLKRSLDRSGCGSSGRRGICSGAGGDQLVDVALDDAALGTGSGGKRGIDVIGNGLCHRSGRDG